MLKSIAEAVDYAHRLGRAAPGPQARQRAARRNGEPQVADFGLAKRLDEALAADSTEVSGTPSYMAPEQARVDKTSLSAATDIYGLGRSSTNA
jgi:serine/threonine protein kinase